MSIFEHDDYRRFFREEISARKKLDSSINFQNMAGAMRIQKPFLSKVINGHSHLNRDQLALATDYLRLDPAEMAYAELVHDYQTSGLKRRQDALLKTIRAVQGQYLETERHLEASPPDPDALARINEYYLDPIYQLVHIAMSVERFRRDLKLMAHDMGFPTERVVSAVEMLEKMRILKREGSEIKVVAQSLHLSRDAKEYHAWSNQLRMFGMHRFQNLPKEAAYGFSVVFSADEDARKKIQAKFLKFIKEVQQSVGKATEKNVYQLNFDLFGWNLPPA